MEEIQEKLERYEIIINNYISKKEKIFFTDKEKYSLDEIVVDLFETRKVFDKDKEPQVYDKIQSLIEKHQRKLKPFYGNFGIDY